MVKEHIQMQKQLKSYLLKIKYRFYIKYNIRVKRRFIRYRPYTKLSFFIKKEK